MLPILAAVLAFITIASVGWVLVGGDDSSAKAVKRAESFGGGKAKEAAARKAALANTPEARRKQIIDQLQDAERRQRQQEALALLRGFVADKPSPAEARAALHAYIQRVAEPPPGPWRDQQQALLEEGCRNTAALHNGTSASQRAQAVRRLQAYQDDLRQLVAAR